MPQTSLSTASIIRTELEKAWNIFQHNGTVRYFAKSENGLMGSTLRSVSALERLVANLEPRGYDIYLHLNPTKGGRIKARREDVTHWRYFMLDLDPVAPTTDPETALNSLLSDLGRDTLPFVEAAAYRVLTGRGAQAWIRLDPIVALDQAETALVAEAHGTALLHSLSRRWAQAHGYHLDTTVSDLPRITRCPGTVNTRSGKRCTVLPPEPTWSVSPTNILAIPIPPIEVGERPKQSRNLIDFSAHLNETAREFLWQGVGAGSRHNDAFAAAKAMHELGIPREAAEYWVLRGAQLCRPQRLSKQDALRCVRDAYKKEVCST